MQKTRTHEQNTRVPNIQMILIFNSIYFPNRIFIVRLRMDFAGSAATATVCSSICDFFLIKYIV